MYQVFQKLASKDNKKVEVRALNYRFKTWSSFCKRHKEVFQEIVSPPPRGIGQDGINDLFVTICKHNNNSRDRESFLSGELLFIDIDNINYTVIQELDPYIQLVADTLTVDKKSITAIGSGHGLHIALLLKNNYELSFFRSHVKLYSSLCAAIDHNLLSAGLKGKTDRQVFNQGAMLRYPFSCNTKKPSRTVMILQISDTAVDFDWKRWGDDVPTTTANAVNVEPDTTNVVNVEPDTTNVVNEEFRAYEPEYFVSECSFLQDEYKRRGEGSSYQAWLAALGVIKVLPDNVWHMWATRLSDGHENYDRKETLSKVYSLQEGGGSPVTCAKIGEIYPGCQSCKYRDTRIGSPVNIRKEKEEYNIENVDHYKLWLESGGENVHKTEEFKQIEILTNTLAKGLSNKSKTERNASSKPTPTERPKTEEKLGKDASEEEIKEYYTALLKTGFSETEIMKNGNIRVVRKVGELARYYKHISNVFHIPELRRIYVWKDHYYQKIQDDHIKNFAQRIYEPELVRESEAKEFMTFVKRSYIKSVEIFDTKHREGLINCQNGVYDIVNNKLLEHSPERYFFNILEYDYDSEAICPTWNQFLQNFTLNRQHIIDTLEEFFGWCIVGGKYQPNKFLVLVGDGANGKTTMLNVIKQILGKENYSIVRGRDLEKPEEAQHLENSLANICEEEPIDTFRRSETFKQLTGDGEISGRLRYENSYKFENRAKLILSYNKPPELKDLSTGFQRRAIFIPCELNFAENKDLYIENIAEKLESERSGILNRLVAAYRRLTERGDFLRLKESAQMYDQFLVDSDDVFTWMRWNVTVTKDKNDFLVTDDLFFNFTQDYPRTQENKDSFAKKMALYIEKRGGEKGRKQVKGKRLRGYFSCKMSAECDEEFLDF